MQNPQTNDSERLADNINESDPDKAKLTQNAQLVDQKLQYQEKIMEDMFLSVKNTEEDLSAYYTHLLNTLKLSDRQVNEAMAKANREGLSGSFVSALIKGAAVVTTAAIGLLVASSISNAALPDATKEELPSPTETILDDEEIEKITKEPEPDAEVSEHDKINDGDILVEADEIIFEADQIDFPEQEGQGPEESSGQPLDYKKKKIWDRKGEGSGETEGSFEQRSGESSSSGGSGTGSGGYVERMPSGSPAPERRDASPEVRRKSPPPQQPQSDIPTNKETQPEFRKDGTKIPRMNAEQARAFMESRNPRGSRLGAVDNRILHSTAEGIRLFEAKYGDKYRVEMFGPGGGKRSSGGTYHERGGALDIVIIDRETGKQLTNFPSYTHMQGTVGETAPIYQKLANEVRTAHEAHYPGLGLRWGGYGRWGKYSLDLMHFDLGSERGHGGGEFETGFTQKFLDTYRIRENVPLPNPQEAARQAYQPPEPQQQPAKKAAEPPAIVAPNRKSVEVPAIVAAPTDSSSVPAIVD